MTALRIPDHGLVVLRPREKTGEVHVQSSGRMRVVLNVHGGQRGLASVIEGLVQRNERAIRTGTAPIYDPDEVKLDPSAAAWRDAPLAMRDRYASGRTAAAWYAASMRATGHKAVVGFARGQPAVFGAGGKLLTTFGGPAIRLGESEGRTDERMVLTIDDDTALPVREVNNAIARHNARRIKLKGLPPLYRSGVKYKTEGSPELWWDAEEILRNGHDDCEGLAAYRAGELINRGYDAQVYTRLVKVPDKAMGGSGQKGGRLFHAVTAVFGPDGQIKRDRSGTAMVDDPSARLGMPRPSWYVAFAKSMRSQGKDL